MSQQGQYPIGSRNVADTDTLTAVVTGATADLPISKLRLFLQTIFPTFTGLAASAGSSLIGYQPAGTGTVATTVQGKLYETVSVLDFGADPTGATDSLPAFNAAHAAMSTDYTGGRLHIPKGKYYLSGTWHIFKRLVIYGDGQGDQQVTTATILTFPKNTTGVQFHALNDATPPPGGVWGSSSNAAISDLQIACADATTTSGDGIYTSSAIGMRNLTIQAMGGRGVAIVTSGVLGGNADFWRAEYLQIGYCKGTGFYVSGSDSQVGLANQVNCQSNGGWQFEDYAYYANQYNVCHAAAPNGSSGSFSATSGIFIGCYVELAGAYGCQLGANTQVIGGVLGNLVNTQRAYPLVTVTGDGTGATAMVTQTNTSTGAVLKVLPLTWGSGYTTAACALTLGSGSGAAITPNIVGGQVTSYTVTGGGTGYYNPAAGVWDNGLTRTPMVIRNLNADTTRLHDISLGLSDVLIQAQPKAATNAAMILYQLYWSEATQTYATGWRYITTAPAYRITTDKSTITGGRASALADNSLLFPGGFWIGDGASARNFSVNTGIPGSGQYAQGDVIFMYNASASSPAGWVCTTTGTAGSTAVFKAMANLAA